jgi:hypothetical protein
MQIYVCSEQKSLGDSCLCACCQKGALFRERERERERDSPSIRRAHAEVVDEAFFFGGQIPMGVVYAIHL